MAVVQNYLPGDSLLIDKIVCELKSQGIFDEFRKECIADVDTKPAYQNLRQRVEGSVSGFLSKQTWNPDMNKNHVRELLRKNIYESGFLEIGVERIVDQVVNPKINSVFLPKVTEVVYKFLGIERPNSDRGKPDITKVTRNANTLLPTDLEAVSPESEVPEKKHDKSNESQNLDDSKIEEDESPPFEPIEEQTTYLPNEENSVDSHLSGFSGLLSHDSNQSQDINKPMQLDISNQDSMISKHSSDGHLSIVMSDDTDMKMEFGEDSHQSKSSKTNDSSSKIFDFNLENSSRSSSSKTERKSDQKVEDKSKTDKVKSYDKHKSKSDSKSQAKDRKDDRDRKSDHDKKDYKDKHSSKSRDKSRDSKDHKSSKSSSKTDKDREPKSDKDVKSDKDRDSKTSESKTEKEKSKNCNGSHHRSSSSSSSSKDKGNSRKESTSKDKEHNSSSRDKSKTSSSRVHKDSKSKDDKDKTHSKHDSKTDKNKKDDKHDRHHSKSEKHSSNSKNKDKDKKQPKKDKKENKDDHFSSKKRSDRRSTDRDSNDGQSGLKNSSSSFDSYFSSQTQSKNQESSNSNSNTGSGDSGASDAMESEIVSLKAPITFVNDAIESVGEIYINTDVQQSLPRIKLIKPKFASNIHEARKLMKIRKQLSKIEQQNALQYSKALNNQEPYLVKTEIVKNETPKKMVNNGKNDYKPNIQKKELVRKHDSVLDSTLQIEIPTRNSVPEEEMSQISPPLKSSVVSAASWDALEAKFNQNIDYSTYYDDPDTPEKTNESIININPNDCLYFSEDVLPVTERYIIFMMTLIERLEKEIASFRQDETVKQNNNKSEKVAQKIDRENGLKSFSKKTFKRKLLEYSDAKNNNKKFNNHHIEVHENFSLPLSPAESDISVDKKSDISEPEKSLKKGEVELSVKFKKNNMTSAKKQRYSSDDLYKPRPFFSGSRRRARNNLELD